MFFNRNASNARRAPAADAALSPRFARLVRESWWLLVVAAFVYLALILATYTRTDPGWSFSGTGAPHRAIAAARSARGSPTCCSTCSARPRGGGSIGGVVLVIAGFRRVVQPERRSAIIRFAARRHRLRARAARERRARVDPALADARDAAARARRRVRRRRSAAALARALGFNGATLLLLALFAVGCSLLFGMSWLQRDGAHRRRPRSARSPACAGGARRPRTARIGEEAARRARARRRADARGRGRARAGRRRAAGRAACRSSERVVKEKQRPLFTDMPDSTLPPLALLEDAPPVAGDGQQRDARFHVAADRAQARRLRRQRARCSPRIRAR